MRSAFSMIMAIFVIVIMAGLLALVSSLSGKIVKETTAQYRHEQAALLAKSYTEFAILAIQGHQMSAGGNNCLQTVTANNDNPTVVLNGQDYRIDIKMQYIGLRPRGIGCPATADAGTKHKSLGHQSAAGTASTSNDVSVTIDVYVQYHDMDIVDALGGSATSTAPWVTFHRRTLQRL